MASISDVANVVIAVTTVIALILAILGYNSWKRELIVNRKMDIAVRLYKNCKAVDRAFIQARNPLGFLIKGEDDLSEEQKRETDRQRRLGYVTNALSEFDAVVLEADVLGIVGLTQLYKQYVDKYSELRMAMLKRFESNVVGNEKKNIIEIVYGGSDDKFSSEIESITSKVEAIARNNLK